MPRRPGTTRDGQPFDYEIVKAVWAKAEPLPTFPGYRRDMYGAPIRYADYGNPAARCGWEIDHIRPIACGGSDELENLQALHWENNRTKGDDWPGPRR